MLSRLGQKPGEKYRVKYTAISLKQLKPNRKEKPKTECMI